MLALTKRLGRSVSPPRISEGVQNRLHVTIVEVRDLQERNSSRVSTSVLPHIGLKQATKILVEVKCGKKIQRTQGRADLQPEMPWNEHFQFDNVDLMDDIEISVKDTGKFTVGGSQNLGIGLDSNLGTFTRKVMGLPKNAEEIGWAQLTKNNHTTGEINISFVYQTAEITEIREGERISRSISDFVNESSVSSSGGSLQGDVKIDPLSKTLEDKKKEEKKEDKKKEEKKEDKKKEEKKEDKKEEKKPEERKHEVDDRKQQHRIQAFTKRFNLPQPELPLKDWSCAYQSHILLHGRMYVSKNYLCFYSNIFGMKTIEAFPFKSISVLRKIKLNFGGILVICNEKAMEFTSFLSRDKTFNYLENMYKAAQAEEEPPPLADEEDEQRTDEDESELDEIDMQLFSNDDEVDSTFLKSTAFKELKDEVFGISLFKFFKIFWSDDTFSILFHHHRNDTEIEVQSWKKDEKLGFVRQLTYRTPLNQPLGPSSCRVEETQRYHLSKTKLTVETVMVFSGIPYGDCFHVETKWEVGEESKHSCRAKSHVSVHWLKKPRLLGGTIESGTIKETGESQTQWVQLAQSQVQSRKSLKTRHSDVVDHTHPEELPQSLAPIPALPTKKSRMEFLRSALEQSRKHLGRISGGFLALLLLFVLQYQFSLLDGKTTPYIAILVGFGILVYQIETLNHRIASMEVYFQKNNLVTPKNSKPSPEINTSDLKQTPREGATHPQTPSHNAPPSFNLNNNNNK